MVTKTVAVSLRDMALKGPMVLIWITGAKSQQRSTSEIREVRSEWNS